MEEPVQNTKQNRRERKSNLVKDEKELLLRIELIDRDIARIQVELDKIHAAHRAIPRAPFFPQKSPIVQGGIIMSAVRARIKEEEERKDQYHTGQTSLNQEIREDILDITRKIDRDIVAAGNGDNIIAATAPPEQLVPEVQLRTDEGVHDANVLVTGKRNWLVRRKEEFEEELRRTREKLKAMGEEMKMDLDVGRELKGPALEVEDESRARGP